MCQVRPFPKYSHNCAAKVYIQPLYGSSTKRRHDKNYKLSFLLTIFKPVRVAYLEYRRGNFTPAAGWTHQFWIINKGVCQIITWTSVYQILEQQSCCWQLSGLLISYSPTHATASFFSFLVPTSNKTALALRNRATTIYSHISLQTSLLLLQDRHHCLL